MRIRFMNILFAAGGYLIGSGKAKQLYREGQRWFDERQHGSMGTSRPMGAMAGPDVSRTPYDAEPGLSASPVEAYTP